MKEEAEFTTTSVLRVRFFFCKLFPRLLVIFTASFGRLAEESSWPRS